MRRLSILSSICLGCAITTPAHGQLLDQFSFPVFTQKTDPKTPAKKPRPKVVPVLVWHMNDLETALGESKKTGKPIFVTFRCEA